MGAKRPVGQDLQEVLPGGAAEGENKTVLEDIHRPRELD